MVLLHCSLFHLNSILDRGTIRNTIKEQQALRLPQRTALADMRADLDRGLTGFFLWLKMRTGKTRIMMEFVKHLLGKQRMPRFWIYILPRETVDAIAGMLESFGFTVRRLWPNSTKPKSTDKWRHIIQSGKVVCYCVGLHLYVCA